MKNKRMQTVAVLLGAIGVVIVILLLIAFVGKGKDKKVKVGFIMSGSCEEAGWNGMHYNGMKNAGDALGVKLLVKENVKEFNGECKTAIRELVEEGAELIILSSYNYSEEVKDEIKKYPKVAFYANSSEYHDVNMTSYFSRMYQARYLAGIVAGMQTKTGKIGYVAAMKNNEVNRGISAFTLGVKKANSEAEVIVAWSGDWDKEEEEKRLAEALVREEGVDVLTYHQNRPNVVETAERLGVYSIGYHEALNGQTGNYLMSVVCNWEMVYMELVKSYLTGNANEKENYWIGMEADAVGLSEYSELISGEIRQRVETEKKEIISGKDVFSGVIYDTEGVLRCEEKEMISDEVLLEQFDWFVEGVRFYEE